MRSITYFSTEAQSFSERALERLIEQCSKKNARLGVTGMLLYKNGTFLQVFEGSDEVIEELYAVVKADPRHKDVVQVVNRPIEQREFEDWEMGFKNLDDLAAEIIPGFTEYANPFSREAFQKDTNRAHQILLYFAKHA